MTSQPIPGPGERARLRLYFLDLRIRYALVVLLLGLVLVQTDLGTALMLAGILWLGAAFVLAVKRPSDREADELLASDLKSLVEKALNSLGTHGMRAAPLAFLAPADPAALSHGRLFRRRAGRDGSLRSPANCAVVVVPMEDQLGVYSCQHDSLSGETTQVSVEEHHYRDVVTLRLEEDVEVKGGTGKQVEKQACRPTQMFSLEFTNGRRLSVPVAVAWQEEIAGGEEAPTHLERTVLAIRALMRDAR